jgi:hypothetical protein
VDAGEQDQIYPSGADLMERRNSPVPNLTMEEYRQLIAEAAFHLAELRGFKAGNLREDWRQAEQRTLTVIADIGGQYVGNTKLYR